MPSRTQGADVRFLSQLSLKIRPLDYARSLQLLADAGASSTDRGQALQLLKRKTRNGIRALHSHASAPEPLELAASAQRWLIRLRAKQPLGYVDAASGGDPEVLEALCNQSSAPLSECLQHLRQLAESIAMGLAAIESAPALPAALEAERAIHVIELREELAR